MKRVLLSILVSIIVLPLYSQSISEKITKEACKSLDTLSCYKQLQKEIKTSVSKAMVTVLKNGTDEEKKILSTAGGIKKTFDDVYSLIPTYCPNIRTLMSEKARDHFYQSSKIDEANKHFDKGQEYLEHDLFKDAIKEYKKAIKIDKNYVLAIDNLAVSYRKLNKFKKAIKYYKKSLDICPEGDLALLNISYIYSILKDNSKSLKYYSLLKKYYPYNPEGYFGASRSYFYNEQYEESVDNMFIAHILYVENKSNYLEDSNKWMNIVYAKLTKINKIQIFNKYAEKYNISVNID